MNHMYGNDRAASPVVTLQYPGNEEASGCETSRMTWEKSQVQKKGKTFYFATSNQGISNCACQQKRKSCEVCLEICL